MLCTATLRQVTWASALMIQPSVTDEHPAGLPREAQYKGALVKRQMFNLQVVAEYAQSSDRQPWQSHQTITAILQRGTDKSTVVDQELIRYAFSTVGV